MIAHCSRADRHAPARAVRGLNKKESICSECVGEEAVREAGWASPRPRMGEQQQCCWRPAQFLG